jgi:hypothetical protein
MKFLAQIPLLAWCNHFHGETDLGGTLDLGAYEIEAMEHGCRSATSMRDFVRAKLVSIGSGWEFISQNAENWMVFRRFLINRLEREREIASLTHRPLFQTPGPKGMTVGELLALPLSPPHEFEARKQLLKAQVLKTLTMQADPDLEDLATTADRFVNLVADERQAALEQAVHPFRSAVARSGLDPESVSLDMDAAFVVEMIMLAHKINTIRDYMGRAVRRFHLKDDSLTPSLELWRRLQRRTGALPRAAGSDIADRYIASFALYLDFVHADKRTNEFIRQTRAERWEHVTMLGSVFAAGTVAKMNAALSALLTPAT